MRKPHPLLNSACSCDLDYLLLSCIFRLPSPALFPEIPVHPPDLPPHHNIQQQTTPDHTGRHNPYYSHPPMQWLAKLSTKNQFFASRSPTVFARDTNPVSLQPLDIKLRYSIRRWLDTMVYSVISSIFQNTTSLLSHWLVAYRESIVEGTIWAVRYDFARRRLIGIIFSVSPKRF